MCELFGVSIMDAGSCVSKRERKIQTDRQREGDDRHIH